LVDLAYAAGKQRRARASTSLSGPLGQRAFDLLLATAIIVMIAPIMLLVAVAIYLEDGGPVLYIQPRIGRHGKVFGCFKFRSMAQDAESRIEAVLAADPVARAQWAVKRKLTRDPRVTLVGRFIRRRSLDELPQLLNVIRGEMAVVGPRPIMLDERKLYGRRLAAYTAARPGITGLWQVSGRGDASFRSRIAMDMVYLRARRLRLDLKILALTIPAVLLSRGSY
jgi:lipopolysaccharide/colanic/teichoic acid biosynthesis glycosyltransferase